jgi:hypothetical protein
MNNGKHTPGPWRTGDLFNTVFGPPNGNPCPKIIASINNGDKKANAILISAAPELLEALKMLTNIATHPQATKTSIRMIAAEAWAAIAKAEGR